MIYTYECVKCKHTQEEHVKLENYQAHKVFCEKCKCEMWRTINPSRFILKGEGWAKDGYSKKTNK